MKKWAYYNDSDPYVCNWVRNLIAAGHVASGFVDNRPIQEVKADDLREFVQVHMFCGIAGWSHALRLAGWPDDRPVWTGSCPCQPFSAAGTRRGCADERHLWPAFFGLIRECRPATVFGEQVASSEIVGNEGEGSRIPAEISEAEPCSRFGSTRQVQSGQARGLLRPYETPFGATGESRRWGMRTERPAIQLGWWQNLGQSITGQDRSQEGIFVREHPSSLPCSQQRHGRLGRSKNAGNSAGDPEQAARSLECALRAARAEFDEIAKGEWLGIVCTDLESEGYSVGSSVLAAAGIGAPHIRQRLYWVADADDARSQGRRGVSERPAECPVGSRGMDGGLADASRARGGWDTGAVSGAQGEAERSLRDLADKPVPDGADTSARPTNGFWRDADWLLCRDGKWRPTQPGLQPLASRFSFELGSGSTLEGKSRIGMLRAYGNAIVPQVAAEFIMSYMETGKG